MSNTYVCLYIYLFTQPSFHKSINPSGQPSINFDASEAKPCSVSTIPPGQRVLPGALFYLHTLSTVLLWAHTSPSERKNPRARSTVQGLMFTTTGHDRIFRAPTPNSHTTQRAVSCTLAKACWTVTSLPRLPAYFKPLVSLREPPVTCPICFPC